MFEKLFDIIKDKYPEIGIAILLIIAIAYVVWKIRDFIDSHKDVKNKVNNLPCDKHSEKLNSISSLSEKLDNLPCDKHNEDILIVKQNSVKLDDITSSIRKIEEWIMRRDVKAMDDLVRKCSPYALTDVGIILLSQSKAKECVDTNLDYLINLLELTNSKTAYDVEKNSLIVLTDIINEDIFNDIKDFVYNSPEYIEIETSDSSQMVEIDLNRILMIMSIYLRDKYFEKHKEIDTNDFLRSNKECNTDNEESPAKK